MTFANNTMNHQVISVAAPGSIFFLGGERKHGRARHFSGGQDPQKFLGFDYFSRARPSKNHRFWPLCTEECPFFLISKKVGPFFLISQKLGGGVNWRGQEHFFPTCPLPLAHPWRRHWLYWHTTFDTMVTSSICTNIQIHSDVFNINE